MTIENGGVTPEQVSLPERLEEPTILGMLPGETTYATPWTMWFDEDGKGWVATEGPLSERSQGTAQMWIARLESGFAVDIRNLDARYSHWRRQSGPQGVGSTSESSVPVIALITNPEERKIVDRHLARLNGQS
jgi:hypothetical protein